MSSISITPENIHIVNKSNKIFDTDYKYLKTSTDVIPVSVTGSPVPTVSCFPPDASIPLIGSAKAQDCFPTPQVQSSILKPIIQTQNYYNPDDVVEISTTINFTNIPTNLTDVGFYQDYTYTNTSFEDTGLYYWDYTIGNGYMKGQVRNITNGAGSVIGTFRWAYRCIPLDAAVIDNIFQAIVRVAPKPVDVVWTGTHDGTISLPYNDTEIYTQPGTYKIIKAAGGSNVFCEAGYSGVIWLKSSIYIALTLVGSEPSNAANLREV